MLNWPIIFSAALLVIGFAGAVVSLILLIIRAIRGKKLKGAVTSLVICAVLAASGVFAAFQTGMVKVEDGPDTASENFYGAGIDTKAPLSFRTTDTDGNPVDESVFSQHRVTMINRWEPWCEHCKDEMPDLQALCEKYGDQGLGIIGVYSDEDGLQEALDSTGVSYPVVRAASGLDFFGRSYPSSVFVDSSGRVMEIPKNERDALAGSMKKFMVIGYRSYEQWENLILGFLG